MRYALIILPALAAMSGSPTVANCQRWGTPVYVSQSNGIRVGFDLTQTGEELSGSADFQTETPLFWGGHDIHTNGGSVEGTWKGNHIELRVRWGDDPQYRPIGVYSMDIDEDGRISGETYDFQNPASRARLLGKVECVVEASAPQPAPDKRRVVHLGKRLPPTQAAPVDPLDAKRPDAAVLVSTAECIQGFVFRDARANDGICVTPESRARAAAENVRAPSLWTAGAYGPHTCVSGFVWREAFDGDAVCVTPEVRDQVRQENALDSSRHAH